MVRHFTDLYSLTPAEARGLMDRSIRLKREERKPLLAGRTLGLIFEKPSLRTRVSFEAAMTQTGGAAIFMNGKDVGIGVRETVADFARVISQYVDALAIRTFSQDLIEELAQHATIPIINALSDASHPCQAMADLLTMEETFGTLEGLTLTFVGDGNNVACSLAEACALLGVKFILSCPEGYSYPAAFVKRFEATFPDSPLIVEPDPAKAVLKADAIYTDVWASMGQESEAQQRKAAFAPYQVNGELFGKAPGHAIFLHCLPAHRGEEVTDEVVDHERSKVIPEAANRLHFQKALLVWLLNDQEAAAGSTSASGSETSALAHSS